MPSLEDFILEPVRGYQRRLTSSIKAAMAQRV
jgi:hypothetical protein